MSDERDHDRIIDAVYEGDGRSEGSGASREALSAEEREEALALQRFRAQLHARMQPPAPSAALKRRVMGAARARIRERREPWAWLTWALAPATAALMALVLWFGLGPPDAPEGRAPSVASVEAPSKRAPSDQPAGEAAATREASDREEEEAGRAAAEIAPPPAPEIVKRPAPVEPPPRPAEGPVVAAKEAESPPRPEAAKPKPGVVDQASARGGEEAERELAVVDTTALEQPRPRKSRARKKKLAPPAKASGVARSRRRQPAMDALVKDVAKQETAPAGAAVTSEGALQAGEKAPSLVGALDGVQVDDMKGLGGVAGVTTGSTRGSSGGGRDDSGIARLDGRAGAGKGPRQQDRVAHEAKDRVWEQPKKADKAEEDFAFGADAPSPGLVKVSDGDEALAEAPATAAAPKRPAAAPAEEIEVTSGVATVTTAPQAAAAPEPAPAPSKSEPVVAQAALEDRVDEVADLETESLARERLEARGAPATRAKRAVVSAKAQARPASVDPCEAARDSLRRANGEHDRVEATRRLARCLVKDNRKAAARTLLQRALEAAGLSEKARDALLDEKARLGLIP
jgi:hypothetical protein